MNTVISQTIKDLANGFYCKARTNFSKEKPVTLLHIGDDYTVVAYGSDASQPGRVWEFFIGSKITARTCFKHELPTPYEVEEAIMMIEDKIMSIYKLLHRNSKLITLDEVIGLIAS